MLASLRLHAHYCRPQLGSLLRATTSASSFSTVCQWASCRRSSVVAAARRSARDRPSKGTPKPQPTALQLLNTYRWPLLAAATQQQWEVCQQLLDLGASDPQEVKQVAAWYAANAGRAQLAVALLKSASAAPPDAGSIISLSPPTVNTLTDGDDSSDEDDWDPDAYLGLDVSLELKVVFGAWRDALNGGDFDTCRALLDFCPDLLRSKGTKSVVEGGLRKESVEFLLGACLQRGASHQQLYSDLLQAALQAAACYAAQDAELYSMEFCIDKGADVNAGQQAFTEDSPLAIAMRQAWRWGNTDHVKVLLDHGAHVHADPTSPESKSALHFAIERFSTEFCELLLRHERVQVGGAELCAAAKVECASSLQLLLQAERNLGPSLRANAEERGRCLKEVLTVAVHSSVFNNRLPWKSRQIVEALLAAPAHWHPLPPDLLDVGMKEVLTVTNKHGLRWELCEVVEVLGKAGADLNIEEGALLMAATKAGWYTRKEFLKALLRGGLDIRIHGGAALMAAPDDHFAAELIRAGAPVNSDPALCKRLMELAAGWSLKDIGPLLGALEKDGAGVKGPLTSKDAGGAGTHDQSSNDDDASSDGDKSEDDDSEMSEG